MFCDEARLPLLALVPERAAITQLPKLRAALLARLERVEETLRSNSSDMVNSKPADRVRRDERDMLKIAIDWISLQEEDHVVR